MHTHACLMCPLICVPYMRPLYVTSYHRVGMPYAYSKSMPHRTPYMRALCAPLYVPPYKLPLICAPYM